MSYNTSIFSRDYTQAMYTTSTSGRSRSSSHTGTQLRPSTPTKSSSITAASPRLSPRSPSLYNSNSSTASVYGTTTRRAASPLISRTASTSESKSGISSISSPQRRLRSGSITSTIAPVDPKPSTPSHQRLSSSQKQLVTSSVDVIRPSVFRSDSRLLSASQSSSFSLTTESSTTHSRLPEIYTHSQLSRSLATTTTTLAESPSTKKRGLVGLNNLGNTCFMNACLQCLSNLSSIRDYFIKQQYTTELSARSPMHGELATEFGKLLSEMWSTTSTSSTTLSSSSSYFSSSYLNSSSSSSEASAAVSPRRFKRSIERWAPRFIGYQQQDSQEFLRFLLDGLHEEVNRVVRPPPYEELKDIPNEDNVQKSKRWWNNYIQRNSSFITDVFLGQLHSSVICQSCNHESTAFDPFMDLSLPLPGSQSQRSSSFSFGGLQRSLLPTSRFGISGSEERSSIYDCLRKFSEAELLTGSEQVYCSKCKKHRDSLKRISVYRFPKVLVLHFKRFSARSHHKLSNEISFPLDDLNLSDFVMNKHAVAELGSPVYTLCGVINHMGGLGGGHYTAYCRNPETQRWFEFNDSRVTAISESRIVSSSAYVLFYVQKS